MESLKLQEGVVESLVTIRASAGVSGRHERVKSFEMQLDAVAYFRVSDLTH